MTTEFPQDTMCLACKMGLRPLPVRDEEKMRRILREIQEKNNITFEEK